jgi:hypothetical protein
MAAPVSLWQTFCMIGSVVDESTLAALRLRLREMSDADLKAYGRSTRMLCRPEAMREPPLLSCEILLEETHAEWRRRHPDRPRRKIPLSI